MFSRAAITLSMAFALSNVGCIKSMLVNGQISSTRNAAGVLDTIGDLDLVESAARAGLVQFEGMHSLAPDNTDALFLLTKGWTSYGYGFCEDHMEEAHDNGEADLEAHYKHTANLAYERAIGYGLELIGKRADGFDTAKKGEATLRPWLKENFTSAEKDAPNLFWLGYAWLARTSLNKDQPAIVADLWVGVALLEHAVELDRGYNGFSGLTALAAYHARSAGAEVAQAKKLFEEALQATGKKSLTVHMAYATRYACAKQDAALYEQTLAHVLAAPDEKPELRLLNAVARKRAKRWLTEKRMFEFCSMDPTPKGPISAKKK